jgi:hypothetical protein
VVKNRGPYYADRVDEAASGKETISTYWLAPRYRYTINIEAVNSVSRQDYQALSSFFQRHQGRLSNFLIVDPEDNTVTDHGFGVGDGVTTAFQLQRTIGGTVQDLWGTWPTSSKPRTNLCTFSEALDNAAWTKTASSATANAGIAPDGNVTAEKLVESATNAQHFASSTAFTLAAGVATYSNFYKAGGRTQIVLLDTVTSAAAAFDLTAGTVLGTASGGTGAITAAGNGWFRCELRFTAGAGATSLRQLLSTNGVAASAYAGDGASGVFVWGAQAEQAAAATQYIKTPSSAAVTSTPSYWPVAGDGFEPVFEVAPGAQLFSNGTLKTQGTDYTVTFNGTSPAPLSGLITYAAAPAANVVLSWTGNYWRRVRLANPDLTFERIVASMWSVGGLGLVSTK